MVLLPVTDRELIEKCLQNIDVCQRCCLRFTGRNGNGILKLNPNPSE